MPRRDRNALCLLLLAVVLDSYMGSAPTPVTAASLPESSPVEQIAALARSSPMVGVPEGPFLMGTARTSGGSFSMATQYDDTEQPQRVINGAKHSALLSAWPCRPNAERRARFSVTA